MPSEPPVIKAHLADKSGTSFQENLLLDRKFANLVAIVVFEAKHWREASQKHRAYTRACVISLRKTRKRKVKQAESRSREAFQAFAVQAKAERCERNFLLPTAMRERFG